MKLPAAETKPLGPPPSRNSEPPFTTKRLRQMAAIVGGGSASLVALITIGQLVLRPELTPAALLATIEAQTEIGVFNQKLGEQPGTVKFTEAEYRQKIAEAERAGQAKADLEYQKQMAVVQADKERVVGAYQTLYQRANMIAQTALQLEAIAQEFRQRLIEMSNGGRNIVISFKDIFCGLGSPEACASAKADRQMMISESDELSRGDAGKRVRELLSGIEDPATLIARDDQRRNGTPALQNN